MFVMKTHLLHFSMHYASLFLYVMVVLTRQIKCQSACSLESVPEVEKIAMKLRDMETNDCVLYTPTLADYENCSKSTLTCFLLEVKVLMLEIQQVPRFNPLQRILNSLTNKDKRKQCPDCEFYREESAKTFLETLQIVLQKMNAENCPDMNTKSY